MVPPACEKIQRMSRNLVGASLAIRLMIIRVVSVPYSIMFGITFGRMPMQQAASVGCV